MKKPQHRTPLALLAVLVGTGLAALPAQAADRTGKEVVETVCAACHTSGKDGAPRLGDRAAWAQRAAKGLDKLTQNAITGVRNMPAHGGQAALTDLEMTRAVQYMVSGGAAADAQKPQALTQTRPGKQVYDERCHECHAEGKHGAPRFGDAEAWRPRAAKGLAALTSAAISGHNAMPARGGMASLSDAEMRAAVEYLVANLNSGSRK